MGRGRGAVRLAARPVEPHRQPKLIVVRWAAIVDLLVAATAQRDQIEQRLVESAEPLRDEVKKSRSLVGSSPAAAFDEMIS